MLEYLLPKKTFRNIEGLRDFNFTLFRERSRPGVSGMVRVRNEERKIEYALRSILPVFDEIIVVDNGSTDRTAELVRDVQSRIDAAAKIRLFSYPHTLARFGPEHGRTAENSVHSAVYFTNWALSHCSHEYVCKWDGDMVLRREAAPAFHDFLQTLRPGRKGCWVLAGQTVYRAATGEFYLAKGEVNEEIEVFPYGLAYRFVKDPHWERFRRPFYLPKGKFEQVCFYELKDVGEREFDHWSTTDWPSERKKREWRNYHRVLEGRLNASFDRLSPTFLDDQIASYPSGAEGA
ncbi:MAG: glycosyltransferase family 2 protein [Gemmatimonadota bacterium]